MAYDTDTLMLCHELTEEGKAAYDELLLAQADQILVNSKHKVLAFFVKLLDMLKLDDSLVQRKYT